jgi:hypothetical protein
VGLTAGDDFISYSLSFLSAVDWLKVLVLAKCKADKSEHHQKTAPATIIQCGYSIAEGIVIPAE